MSFRQGSQTNKRREESNMALLPSVLFVVFTIFFCRIRYSAVNISVWWEYGREIREVKKLRMKAGSQCSMMGKVINLIKLFDNLFTVAPVTELIWGLFEKFLSLHFEKYSLKYQNNRWGTNRWICSIRHF